MDEEDIVDANDVAEEPMFGDASDDAFATGGLISDSDLDAMYAETTAVPRPFGKTWEFNFQTGQFIKEGGRVAEVDGRAAFAQWCMNVLHTERLTALVYSGSIGIEFEPIVRSNEGATALTSRLKVAVEQALSVHGRFDSLARFDTRVDGDTVYIDMTVTTTEGDVEVAGKLVL